MMRGDQTYRDPPPTYEASTSYIVNNQGALPRYEQSHDMQSNPRLYQPRQGDGQQTYRSTHYQENISSQPGTSRQTTHRSTRQSESMEYQRNDAPRPVSSSQQQTDVQIPPQSQNPPLPAIHATRTNGSIQREASSLTQSGSTNIISVSQQDIRSGVSLENRKQSNQPKNKQQTSHDTALKMSTVDENLNAIMTEIDEVKIDLKKELETRKTLEKTLADTEKEKRDLNAKLAALRVKLGVANANINVGKSETDQLRTKFQEAQVHKARLEERITTCTAELERMRDPKNPDSNVNMKKLVSNDRKEIRKLRMELEAAHEERDETHKQLADKELKIKELELMVTQAAERKDRIETDLELAISHKELEYLERQEIEKKYNELMVEKIAFDEKVSGIKEKIGSTSTGMNEMQRKAEEYRKKEESTRGKIDKLDKQLRDVLTEIEQLKSKGRGMPARIAGSIKDHQYRMSQGGKITDTIPAGKGGDIMAKPVENEKAASNGKPGGKGNLSNFVPPAKAKGVSPRTKLR